MKYKMTFENEIGRGSVDSRGLHIPSPSSGITIGPGYDLLHRSENEVVFDLVKGANVSIRLAKRISKGVGLKGAAALEFIKSNEDIKITDEQEKSIFNFIVVGYRHRAMEQYNRLNIPNKPDFDELPTTVEELLVDYAYNVGVHKFPSFFTALITGDRSKAFKEYIRYTGGVPLGRRNLDTVNVLNDYDFKDLRK